MLQWENKIITEGAASGRLAWLTDSKPVISMRKRSPRKPQQQPV